MNASPLTFNDLIDSICARSPLQRKRLTNYLAGRSTEFIVEANQFTRRYAEFLQGRGIPFDYAVDSYLRMCDNMLRCQVKFFRTGRYPVTSAEEATQGVYQSEVEMLSYMVGLGISQFLWPTHYRIFGFFKEAIGQASDSMLSYLEVGPGHGLFLEHALGVCRRLNKAVAIDISPTSLDLTKSIIQHFKSGETYVEYVLGDVNHATLDVEFDFITMGEVLEHVDKPQELLTRLRDLLAPGGKAFISTCANCPAIDHVYQFNKVAEIRSMIASSDLHIVRDLALPVEDMPVAEAEARRITINYCALLEK